jgi:hypothetical protein
MTQGEPHERTHDSGKLCYFEVLEASNSLLNNVGHVFNVP